MAERPETTRESTSEETLYQILNKALVTVGATGGSLMLVDSAGECLEIIARLGLPNPDRQEEPKFRIGDESVAGYVAKTGRAYLCPDVEKDPHFVWSRSGRIKFRSLLAVPILSGNTVLGVINADSDQPNFFTKADEQVLTSLAEQAAIVAATIVERLRLMQALIGLHEVGVSLTRLSPEGGPGQVLRQIVNQACKVLNADVVTLYEYDENRNIFVEADTGDTGPIHAGTLLTPWPTTTRIYPDDAPWRVIEGGMSVFLDSEAQVKLIAGSMPVPARDGEPKRLRFAEREKIASLAALLLRVGHEKIGVMFVNYRTPHQFTGDERRIIETFGSYAAIAINNARLFAKEQTAREQLRKEQERRLAAEAWATLGKAAANLAHRINNTIAAIPPSVAEIEMLPQARVEKKEIRDRLQRIERNARYALELADQLLRPFRPGEAGYFEVNALLDQAIGRIRIPTSIKLVRRYGDNLPKVHTTGQLQVAFEEFLSNAIKAMPRGGQLEIGSRELEGKWVQVWFADSGHGIPEEVRNRLFGMFVASDAAGYRAGLGLGLWWVKTFVEQQGGTITFQDEPKGGTRFILRLPVERRMMDTPVSNGGDRDV